MPGRTCVGCRTTAEQAELTRYVRLRSGEIVADPERREPGRGAYLHRRQECEEAARKRRSLERALKSDPAKPGVNSGVPE
ncbi:MAG TPA: YlxR family protein [Candidatus Dormibacteraeota bacterium]